MKYDISIEKHMTPAQIISTFEHNCEYMGPVIDFKLWGPTHCYSGLLWAEDPDVNKYITNWLGSEVSGLSLLSSTPRSLGLFILC